MSLRTKAWLWLSALALVLGALIFGAAGDLRFWQGWTFLAVFFGASALITQYLIANDPALLERRGASPDVRTSARPSTSGRARSARSRVPMATGANRLL